VEIAASWAASCFGVDLAAASLFLANLLYRLFFGWLGVTARVRWLSVLRSEVHR